MFEHRAEPLLTLQAFRRRMVRFAAYALGLIAGSLIVGTLGFWYFAEQTMMDAWLNSAMLLGGMGPVGDIRGTSGKLFASGYALYAGLAFLGVAGIFFAPIFHRVLHSFHLEAASPPQSRPAGRKPPAAKRTEKAASSRSRHG